MSKLSRLTWIEFCKVWLLLLTRITVGFPLFAFMAHRSTDLPWSFLNTKTVVAATVPSTSAAPSPQRKSFAQSLTNVCDVKVSKLPKPCLKGEKISIEIPEEAYKQGLDRCKNNLHGRLMMAKGDKPLWLNELREKLVHAWAPVEKMADYSFGQGLL